MTRNIGNRSFQGRYFYSIVDRLGTPRNRKISLDQAIAALDDGDLGTKYFGGVDLELMEIIARQSEDLSSLLTFGVRGKAQ